MASRAAIIGLVVRKGYDERHPDIGGMTSFAQLCGLRMSRGFVGSWANAFVTTSVVT